MKQSTWEEALEAWKKAQNKPVLSSLFQLYQRVAIARSIH